MRIKMTCPVCNKSELSVSDFWFSLEDFFDCMDAENWLYPEFSSFHDACGGSLRYEEFIQ